MTLFVVLLINPTAGRVDLLGVFSSQARALAAAVEGCPNQSYWEIVEVALDESLPIQSVELERQMSRPAPIAEEDRCGACCGAGLNDERTALCAECKGSGRNNRQAVERLVRVNMAIDFEKSEDA
jgi:DnaJ-class molecular chaperone